VHERAVVRGARLTLQRWPFRRGRERIWRAVRRFLPRTPFYTEMEPGIVVLADLDDYILRYYFINGLSQDPAFQLIRGLVRPGDVVIDVGAHVGLWVMGVARAAGPTAAVHAFEPLPGNFESLTANVRRNGLEWIQCHPQAVADVPGEAEFKLPRTGNTGVGSLSASAAAGPSVHVRVTTLDAFCQGAALPRVDFLKVDAEGAELRIFRGSRALIESEKGPLITFEVGDTLAAAFGSTAADTKRFLVQAGYGIYRCRHDKLESVPADAGHPTSEDLVALRAAHLETHPRLRQMVSG
jgi:FkbM family methyltransferase